MKTHTKVSAALMAACTTIAACTPPAADVQARYVSPAGYNARTCAQLATEAAALAQNEARLAAAQDKARANDTNIVTAAVILLPVAGLLAMANKDYAAELSAVRGELEAVEQARSARGC